MWFMRWLLKACPRCRGDLYLERDGHKLSASCLQCGFEWSGSNIRQMSRVPREVELATA